MTHPQQPGNSTTTADTQLRSHERHRLYRIAHSTIYVSSTHGHVVGKKVNSVPRGMCYAGGVCEQQQKQSLRLSISTSSTIASSPVSMASGSADNSARAALASSSKLAPPSMLSSGDCLEVKPSVILSRTDRGRGETGVSWRLYVAPFTCILLAL